MKHIIFFNQFNESLSSITGLKFNIRSTVDGYLKLKNEDPSISGDSETEIDKLIITDPREYFNYKFDKKRDTENKSSIDSENVLRIRIGGKDFTGRSGGVTHIMVRVPENFNYNKFESELSSIRHTITNKSEVERVIREIEYLIIKCIDENKNDSNHEKDVDHDRYIQDILEFINPIVDKIGSETTKKILTDIINRL
jgi:hypothetical protein